MHIQYKVVAAVIIGPRVGRFTGRKEAISGHSIPVYIIIKTNDLRGHSITITYFSL